ncbi:hypothetical protein Bbelb_283410 [Branchiostoma belcheri]|nr:hypothetical protein Bbelb_283410 [Branchiostoma belcheri]
MGLASVTRYDFTTDIVDQRIGFYTCKTITARWTMVAFAYLLDTCRVNSCSMDDMNKEMDPRRIDSLERSDWSLVHHKPRKTAKKCEKWLQHCPRGRRYEGDALNASQQLWVEKGRRKTHLDEPERCVSAEDQQSARSMSSVSAPSAQENPNALTLHSSSSNGANEQPTVSRQYHKTS